MARHFSETEKQTIKKKLLHEGKVLLEKYGVKKTSVDKIVEKVGIAKGSFYNFYPSKESMVFDIVLDIETEIHKEEMNNLHTFLAEYEFPEAMKHTVLKSLGFMQNEPLLLIVNDPQLIQEIWSKSSEQQKERSTRRNQNRVTDFIQAAGQKGYSLTVPATVFEASLMSFFLIYINQNMVGESGHEALELMMKATFGKIFVKGCIGDIKGEKSFDH
ncbi:transcriptional regulator, TetR family [Desulfotomaculum arcticum]|uniref:Transcriptional regulator, TetR family n=1 Tax=Desulfotruncus arcticus DSM 17038 TaxID=1121424 RepID=A0A1I2YUX7_9FIRM|nr:TetR/AcrR family transcriptional regulator [Desulfotruncus arcticus]SFH28916.1 transcriptional regulator, TetR family [Desulfotomaculum arcticum] [Desulfotruncus arcticus DSM 17038]